MSSATSTSASAPMQQASWLTYLSDAPPPAFPSASDTAPQDDASSSGLSAMLRRKVQLRTKSQQTASVYPLEHLVRLAWALVNAVYTDSDDVVFGLGVVGGDNNTTPSQDGEEHTALPSRFSLPSRSTSIAACLSTLSSSLPALSSTRTNTTLSSLAALSPDAAVATSFANQLVVFHPAAPARRLAPPPASVLLSLEVSLQRSGAAVSACAFYDPTLLAGAFVGRVLATFDGLLAQLHAASLSSAAASATTVADLALVSATDMADLTRWNATLPLAATETMHARVARRAGAQPDAEAVCAPDCTLSYGQLELAASNLARVLVSQHGVRNNDEAVVPFMFDKCGLAVVAMLAALKAGAAFVPLDTAHAWADTEGILTAVGATVVLCSPEHAPRFVSRGVAHVVVDAVLLESTLLQQSGNVSPLPTVPASAPGYVIFTSGSTGRPKGIVCSHSAWVTNALAHGAAELNSSSTRHLQFSAYTFDIAVSDVFTTLAFGGAVCVPTPHERVNDVRGAVNRLRINHAALTPTVAQFLGGPKDVPSLEVLVCGGEPMGADFVKAWAGEVKLMNSYGPAECTSRASFAWVDPDEKVGATGGSVIGTPCGGALWVTCSADPARLLPVGAVGELLVEGAILAEGYLGDAAKTAAAFIDAPEWLQHAAFPGDGARGKKVYRTGDLVRYDDKGRLVFVGRRDTQVKVHGVRLECGAVEAKVKAELHALGQTGEDVAVVVDKIYLDGKRQALAAFVALPSFAPSSQRSGTGSSSSLLPATPSLRAFVAALQARMVAALPSYMVPNFFVPVDAVPLGATGKTNRRALQALVAAVSEAELAGYANVDGGVDAAMAAEPPRTRTEKQLASIWADVLGGGRSADDISRSATFFQLGGDSVSAMKLVGAAAASPHPIAISVADIFQFPALCDLAAHVDGLSDKSTNNSTTASSTSPSTPPAPFSLIGGSSSFVALRAALARAYPALPLRAVEDVLPATATQAGMMAETVLAPESYVLQEVLRLAADVDVERLRAAWRAVVAAEPVLRTRIVVGLKGLAACQVVLDADEMAEQEEQDGDEDEIVVRDMAALAAFLDSDKKDRPMGYGDVLSRVAFVSTAADGNRYMVWSVHHAVTDGHMHRLVLAKLAAAYRAGAVDGDVESNTPFASFVRHVGPSTPDSRGARFWADQFAGLDATNPASFTFPVLPQDHEPAVGRWVSRPLELPATAQGYTAAMLLRAAWALVVAQQVAYAGEAESGEARDVVLGVTQAGRDVRLPGVETVVGPCLATVPVRVRFDAATTTTKQLLDAVRAQYVATIEHQHFGLQHIRKASAAAAAACGFGSVLVVQPSGDAADAEFADVFTRVDAARNAGDDDLGFALMVEVALGGGSNNNTSTVRAGFDTAVLSAQQADLLLARLQHVLAQLAAASPDALVGRIAVTAPEDVALLRSFNPAVDEVHECLHWRLEKTAASRPRSVAVDAWDARLTFADLDAFSTKLANRLMQLGVGPENIVPFAFEKSAWAVVAMHAILKAGGACVALDPSHPSARHAKIVADCEATVIVSSALLSSQFAPLVAHVVAVSRTTLSDLAPAPANFTSSPSVRPDNAAFVVYSSGSTGTPKGSVLSHAALCTTSRTNSHVLGVGPGTRAVGFAAYAFDVAIEENVLIPMLGGTVCVPSDEERLSDLPGAMRRLRVDWADLTPTVARLLSPDNAPCLRTLVLGGEALTKDIIDCWAGSAKVFNTYGPSECSIQCTATASGLSGSAQGANIGRPANCRLWVVDADDCHVLLPVGCAGELLIEGPIVGRGYLKEAKKTAAAFVSGLRWTADKSRRFYRTGDLAKFNPDGTLDCLGRRDTQIKLQGQRVELGEIEYQLARCASPDNGQEAANICVEAFTPAAAKGSGSSRKLLAAFVQLADGKAQASNNNSDIPLLHMTPTLRATLAAIKAAAGATLPAYMVPSLFVPLARLPVNTSGKTDRKKLRDAAATLDKAQLAIYSLAKEELPPRTPSPATSSVESMPMASPALPPAVVSTTPPAAASTLSPAESVLASLWAAVLHVDLAADPIRPSDSFLELGGDSITAMQLVGKARAAGVQLSVPKVLKSPRLADMALAVGGTAATTAAAPVVVAQPAVELAAPMPITTTLARPAAYAPFSMLATPALPVSTLLASVAAAYPAVDASAVEDMYPCTALQSGLVALTASTRDAYVLRDVYRLSASVDVAQFKGAWAVVVRKTPILRTRVVFVDGVVGGVQMVLDERISWGGAGAKGVDEYLVQDRTVEMGYGTPLARYAVVRDELTQANHFVWSIHHALYDGFSIGLTLAAVDHAYAHALAVPPALPFVDFVRDIRRQDPAETDAFWRAVFKGVEPVVWPQGNNNLNEARQPQADATVEHVVALAPGRKIGRGVTLATVLKAAWAVLVARLSDAPDVVFGVTTFGRDGELEGIETVNGPTITTVPVRVAAPADADVADLLTKVHHQALDVVPHSHAGLQNIAKVSDAANAACKFQNLLVIQPAEEDDEAGKEDSLFRNHDDTATAANYLSGFALVVECGLSPAGDRVDIAAHHDSAVISSDHVRRALHQFEHVAKQLVEFASNTAITAALKLTDLSLLCAADRDSLAQWNGPSAPTVPETVDACIHATIAAQALATPSFPAIQTRAASISYARLDALATHLAHQLVALHRVGPEVLVPVCLEKSAAAVVVMLAVHKAGGGFVPLNPQDPIERLRDLVDQVDARVVVFSHHTEQTLAAKLCVAGVQALTVGTDLSTWGGDEELNTSELPASARAVTPSNVAYALFTSGSTGRPKAVVMTHGAASSSCRGHGIAMGFAEHSRRALQFATYTFDACIAEIFTTLLFGGTICVPTETERLNDLAGFVRDLRCDWAFFTPSFARLLSPEEVPSLATVVLGGEALTKECVDIWGDKTRLMNGYGPTETCVFCVTRDIPGNNAADAAGNKTHRPETIGRPVSSVGWVVDANDHAKLAPVGSVGELLVQGPSLARGYLKNKEKTDEAFVPAPAWVGEFGYDASGVTLYKTGDLVRQDVADGSLTYLGRKDNQTKVNGQRLELGEIETQLKAKSEAVDVAVVLAGKTSLEPTKTKLAALVLFKNTAPPADVDDASNILLPLTPALSASLRALQSAARAALPKYMVPSFWAPVGRIPTLAASGKTDRKSLTALFFKGLDVDQLQAYVLDDDAEEVVEDDVTAESTTTETATAESTMEARLCALIARCLGREATSVRPNDSFLRLGGDSITAIQLVGLARREGVAITTETIFRRPVVRDMAAAAGMVEGFGKVDEAMAAAGSSEKNSTAEMSLIAPFSLLPSTLPRDAVLEAITSQYHIPAEAVADVMPCTPLQEGLITLTVKDKEAYVLRETYRLPLRSQYSKGKTGAGIDLARFRAAWELVVEDAAVLRTRIVNLDLTDRGLGAACLQVVMTSCPTWHDSAKSVKEYMDGEGSVPFGYGTPLMKLGVVCTPYNGTYFVWTIHHSLYDGWSKGTILRRVEEAYRAAGPVPTLKQPSPPFSRFIRYLESETDPAQTRAFWQDQFRGLEAQSYPRLPSPGFDAVLDRTYSIEMPLPASLADGAFTASTILKAAWAVVQARYTGASDALFGIIQTGRTGVAGKIDGVADMIGPTITTVPLRIRLDAVDQKTGRPLSIRRFLQAVQDQSTDMIAHEHAGLQNIARMGGSECREAAAFTNIMVIQPANSPQGDLVDAGFLGCSRIHDTDKGFLRFALGLECTLGEGFVAVTGAFDDRLMTEDMMRRMLFQFRAAVVQLCELQGGVEDVVVGEPSPMEQDQPTVASIDLVSAEDRTELLAMNGLAASATSDVWDTVHTTFSSVARGARADAVAVNAWDVDFSYGELDALSSKLAHRLRALGVGAETIVPLCFEKSGWAVVALLGVVKAGGAFVFLDPAYPMARLEEIFRQVDSVGVVLTSLEQAALWKGPGRHEGLTVQVVDNVSIESLPSATTAPIDTGARPDSALYVIFTSGSTGKPKGCVIEHHSFLTCARAQATRGNITATSRVLQGASYSFDVSVMEMLTALSVGACICVPSERAKSRSIVDVINDFRITWAFLTPSVVKFISPRDVPCLETLVLGGEALTTQNIATWAGRLRLINGYGPSECTIAAAANTDLTAETDPANIGKALGGICWITDPEDHNRLAPLGTIGELLIEGPIVARGYLNNPEKTAEVFVENPDWAEPQEDGKARRLYKTGDLAYFNTDGSIMFVGRKDTQVKVRGQRMELGEIETHLSLNKDIQHAMVLYPKAGPCKRKLVGIVSLSALGASTNTSGQVELLDAASQLAAASSILGDVQTALANTVPSYMVPTIWIVLRGFPLLVSGKLNRKRVEQWVAQMDAATHKKICGIGEEAATVAPASQLEQDIRTVWADVLKLPQNEIGTTHDFSSLGGDSILAMVVIARLKKLGTSITVNDMLKSRTIGKLAALIASGATATDPKRNSALNGAVASAADLDDITDELFDLSPMQQLYANFALQDNYLSRQTNKRFNHTFCLRVRGPNGNPISASTLSAALEKLVARHGMLRARFVRDADAQCGWRQFVSTKTTESYRFRAWDNYTVDQVRPSIEKARTGLDLEKGPLMAADLVTVDANTQFFFVVAHHLVVDLVSWRTILRDLEDLVLTGECSADRPYPFSRWAVRQKEYAEQHLAPEAAYLSSANTPAARDSGSAQMLPPADFAYWGMEDSTPSATPSSSTFSLLSTNSFDVNGNPSAATPPPPRRRVNIVRDTTHRLISIPARETAAILSLVPRQYGGAEPLDVVVAALSQSFAHTFRDRDTPAIYRFNHGRGHGDVVAAQDGLPDVDVSETVGWFSTISPVHVRVRTGGDGGEAGGDDGEGDDCLTVLRRAVEARRRKLPHNGWAYFASRYHHPEGHAAFGHQLERMEVSVNYLGVQDGTRTAQGGGLAEMAEEDVMAGANTNETKPLFEIPKNLEGGLGAEGQEVKCMSLFSVGAEVRAGRLELACTWNRRARDQEGIESWWAEFERCLLDVAHRAERGDRMRVRRRRRV